MKPKLWACILLTLLLLPIAAALLLEMLLCAAWGEAGLMVIAAILGCVGLFFVGLVAYLWVMYVKAVRENPGKIS